MPIPRKEPWRDWAWDNDILYTNHGHVRKPNAKELEFLHDLTPKMPDDRWTFIAHTTQPKRGTLLAKIVEQNVKKLRKEMTDAEKNDRR